MSAETMDWEAQCELLPPLEALRILSESAEQVARYSSEETGPAATQFAYFGIKLGGLGLLLDTDKQKEIISAEGISAVPGTPGWLAGFVNLRSLVIPVFDVARYLGLQPEENDNKGRATGSKHLLVIGDQRYGNDQANDTFALITETLPAKVTFEEAHILPTPPPWPGRLKPFCGRTFKHSGVWCEWDVEGFVDMMCLPFHS